MNLRNKNVFRTSINFLNIILTVFCGIGWVGSWTIRAAVAEPDGCVSRLTTADTGCCGSLTLVCCKAVSGGRGCCGSCGCVVDLIEPCRCVGTVAPGCC